jgi:hypothetical protein
MATFAMPPRPCRIRTPKLPTPEQILASMSLSAEDADFFAAQHVPVWEEAAPEPDMSDAEDTWVDAHKGPAEACAEPLSEAPSDALEADERWFETGVAIGENDPDATGDFEASGELYVGSPPPRYRPSTFRFAAAAIFAVLVAMALVSTTRRSAVPTAHAAEPVMVHRKAPLPAIPAPTAEATQEIELLPTPTVVPAKLSLTKPTAAAAKVKSASPAAKPPTVAKPVAKKPGKPKTNF